MRGAVEIRMRPTPTRRVRTPRAKCCASSFRPEAERHDPCSTPETPTSEAAMPESQTRTSKGTRGARGGADARREPERQKENQKRLGVGPDHKTPEMKKGHRGTFP